MSVTPPRSATTSSGYAPRSTGSRKIRLASPSIRRAASASSADGVAGEMAYRLRVMPHCVPGARSACDGQPVAEHQVVRRADRRGAVLRPGACAPDP